jgi:tape measure domain-containing protein
MNNTLTYRLMMQDNMSAVLKKVGVITDQTTSEIKGFSNEVNGLNKINLSGILSSITKIAGVLGVGALIGKTIKEGMEQETRNTSLEVLLGGVDNAKKMIDDVSTYAAKSPYGKAGLSEAVQMMSGFGIAQEKIMPNLKAIGDIAMGDENKFNALSLAFSQMSSTGKLMGQDLMQMINAGFNPLEQMSKTTGKSIAQLKDDMSKGAISSEMVTQAFKDATSEGGKYYGMIDKISNTASGQWATAMDNVSEMMLNLYSQVIQPILLPALKKVNEFFDNNSETIKEVMGTIGEVVNSVYTKISEIFGKVSENSSIMMGIIQPLLDIVKDVFSTFNDLYNIISNGNLSEYFAPVVDLLQNYVVPYARQLWDFIKDIVLKVVEFVSNSTILRDIFKVIVNNVKITFKVVSWVVDKLKLLFDNVVMPILNAIEKAYRLLNGYDEKTKTVTLTSKKTDEITNPALPGTDTATETKTSPTKNNTETKKTASAIATGGQKTTNITINLKDLVNTININREGFTESAENMRDAVLDQLARLLGMAQGIAV